MWNAISQAIAFFSEPNEAAEAFYKFYAANLRGSLFTGFLTLTGFLFAVKTFIIVNMKKEVYETKEYHERVMSLKQANPNLTIYGPLIRLSHLLFVAVMTSLCASVSQLTIGLWPAAWSAALCVTLAALAVALLIMVLFLIRNNLSSLFDILERRASKQDGNQ